jgi:CelD/BcsL family acetyltransferase involved in cellulose biosynthesis
LALRVLWATPMESPSQKNLPRVEAFRALESLSQHLPAIEELNRHARRPSPFHTPQYLAAYLAHDEKKDPAAAPLLLVAFDEKNAPVGFLPLKTRPEKVLGLAQTRVEFLTTHTTDRPGLIARAADERRCVDAFLRHLTTVEKSWAFLELMEQDDSSPLSALPVDPQRYYLRRYPNNPNSTLVLEGDFQRWFKSLSKNVRQNVARGARHLWNAGLLEYVTCDEPRAASAMLDLYLELEMRSWKAQAAAGISRHPERVELFRAMLGAGGESRPIFHFLLIDGVASAGLVTLAFGGTVYEMELAYDSHWSAGSPGNVVFVLAVRDCFARGVSAFNLLGNFAYYKARWSAKVTPTHAVQVYRRGTLHQARAIAGEWKRRLFGAPRFQQDVDFNLSKPTVSTGRAPLLPHSRALAESLFEELRQKSVPVEHLLGDALAAAFPFSMQGGSRG